MNRYPDYEQRAALASELCNDEAAIKEAQSAIYSGLIESVETIKSLRDNVSVEPSVRLNAAKHHLKLAGLEVERKEVDHRGLTIQDTHAAKVVALADLSSEGVE